MKLSIGKAWEETSAFLGREARLVAPVALATFALPSVLVGWAYPGSGPGNAGGLGILLLLAVLIVLMVGQMTIALLSLGWNGSIGEAMGKVARRVPALLAAALIIFLPLSLIAVVALGGALVGAGITDPATLTPEALAAIPNIGWIMLLFIVIFLFASVRLFPISAVAANEAGGPISLLKRSWTLTKGRFGRLLVLLLLLGLGALILNVAVTAVVGSLATLVVGEPKPFNLSALIVALASGLVGALVSAVSAAMVGRVYAQLSVQPSVPSSS